MNIITINNQPSAEELWAGIGGHFDNLGQIINEFLDNSISNFVANPSVNRNLIVSLKELQSTSQIEISIEDSGTGIKKLDEAFTLGNTNAGESPLNEHGFGLKHALASANPENSSWEVYTRTAEDYDNNSFKKISAPYKIHDFQALVCANEVWPGQLSGSGTLVRFTCSWEMFKTTARGIRGGVTSFRTMADILCEDIGFIYAGVIASGGASITMSIENSDGIKERKVVGAVEPDWADFIKPGSGMEQVDLGSGKVDIEYKFGRINEKASRKEFDNSTTRKYYMKNMSSSGVEIRINGRVLCYNLFKEIWGIEKHNSYNYLLVVLNLKSQNKDSLPKTRTSKNGLREGDPKLEKLYSWIKSNMPEPKKDLSMADHETDLFEELRKNKEMFNPDPNKIITTEMQVFKSTGENKDKVRIDLYEKTSYGVTIYEGKKETTTSKDVYQLRMYWDGLVFDGIIPNKGILVAERNPESVKSLIKIVNTMRDANDKNYNFEAKTWAELGINLSRPNTN